MKRTSWPIVAIALLPSIAGAQTQWPHITAVKQSTGLRGQTCTLTVTGVHIGEGTGLLFQDGLTAESLSPPKPPAPGNVEGTLTARIRIPPTTAPGLHVFRVLTPTGPSDPGYLVTGVWPEVAGVETNSSPDKAQRLSLPVTVTGKLGTAGLAKWFAFSARKGESIVLEPLAQGMHSPLAPTLTVQDSSGREIAATEDFGRPDCPVTFTAPADGEYRASLHDIDYRGGGDYAYRLTIGAIPYISSAFPPGAPAGRRVRVQLAGANVPPAADVAAPPVTGATQAQIEIPGGAPAATPFYSEEASQVPLSAPDAPAKAQTGIPGVVYGRVMRSPYGGLACSSVLFAARKGERLRLTVTTRPLGSALAPVLTVLDRAGKQLGTASSSNGADIALDLTAPGDGVYTARVADTAGLWGPERTYRLAVAEPRPNYSLTYSPDRLAIPRGGYIPITISAARADGQSGDISLDVSGLPAGVQASGSRLIPAGQSEAVLLLGAAADAPVAAGQLHISGSSASTRGGLLREAGALAEEFVKVDDRIERRTHPSELPAACTTLPADLTLKTAAAGVTLTAGQSVEIAVSVIRANGFAGKVKVSAARLPPGVSAAEVEAAEKAGEVKLVLKAAPDAAPGVYQTVVLGTIQLDELHPRPFAAPLLAVTVQKRPAVNTAVKSPNR